MPETCEHCRWWRQSILDHGDMGQCVVPLPPMYVEYGPDDIETDVRRAKIHRDYRCIFWSARV